MTGPENHIGDGMRLEWFSKHPVCKRPCRYYSYDVSFAVQYIKIGHLFYIISQVSCDRDDIFPVIFTFRM